MLIYMIIAAVILDLLLGDPRFLPHPVVLIGKAISSGEKIIRKVFAAPAGLKTGGMLLALAVVGSTYLFARGLIEAGSRLHPYLGIMVEIWLLYTAFAVKGLHRHAREVALPLAQHDLPEARRKVALIVGRDTDNLDAAGVTRAVVETVAENTVDGIVAPLFYAFIGGAPLALAYKAVNTLDSMIGHKEERYLHLGWAGARLDDLANYLPARLTGLLFLVIAPFTPRGFKRTWYIIKRDAGKHPSPNGGIPEAAVAGALGIKLGGLNYYFGQPSYRQELGDELMPLHLQHIGQAVRMMYAVAALTCFLGISMRIWI